MYMVFFLDGFDVKYRVNREYSTQQTEIAVLQ